MADTPLPQHQHIPQAGSNPGPKAPDLPFLADSTHPAIELYCYYLRYGWTHPLYVTTPGVTPGSRRKSPALAEGWFTPRWVKVQLVRGTSAGAAEEKKRGKARRSRSSLPLPSGKAALFAANPRDVLQGAEVRRSGAAGLGG